MAFDEINLLYFMLVIPVHKNLVYLVLMTPHPFRIYEIHDKPIFWFLRNRNIVTITQAVNHLYLMTNYYEVDLQLNRTFMSAVFVVICQQ